MEAGMRVRVGRVARLLGAAILSVAIIASAGAASAAAKAKPPADKWPAFLKGSVKAYSKYFNGDSTQTDHMQVAGLRLKRQRVKVMGSQVQVVYRVADGNVTRRNETDKTCVGRVSFTETFSLKGAKWDVDSRITFFAPSKGRFKNRWRVHGHIGLVRDKRVGTCTDPPMPALIPLPPLFDGPMVGETPPVARPGTKVRARHESHSEYGGSVWDRKETMTIRLPKLKR
jgi:hypothetical protein